MSETREYYFVSDLHIGADEQFDLLDYERIQKAPPRELSLLQRLVAK